jgi:hypothetical protein
MHSTKNLLALLFFGTFPPLPASIFAQPAPARFALVIGNGNYNDLGKLANPANDASDMAAALKSLGFETQLLVDADLGSMEDAVVGLGNRLAASSGSTGFFYYAGHGVQSNGINYLIPADAWIASEAFLRTKALAAQTVLETLQSAKNGLNVIVLDACRDNPFGWSRSGTRGLSVVGSQPTGSILVYATRAGSVAQDGSGRNGIFTQELLKNLQTPGLEIKEVFNRTGAGVRDATGGKQVPAVYNQFFDSAYLGTAGTIPAETASLSGGKPADLMVKASEAAAEIFIDGVSKGKAPLLVSALPSGRNVHIEARSDTSSGVIDVSLKPGELREVSIAMAARTGNLVISSNENAVRVLLDGNDKGALGSGVLRDVPVGAHRLELLGQDLYFGTDITVPPEATIQVSAKVEPVGSLAIKIPAGASVSVASGGQSRKLNGPGVLANLPTGTWTLSAGGGDWTPASATLTIAKGQHASWEPWKDGTIVFAVNSANSICILDGGQGLDTSRPATGIAPGTYKAILRKPGYLDREITLAVALGKQTSVKASLELMKSGIIKIASLGVDLWLIVEGQTLTGKTDPDGSLRFDGVPAGYPVTIGFSSANAQILAVPETKLNLAEGETVKLEVPTGRITLPWIASDATIEVTLKRFVTSNAGGQSWTSPALPIGSYHVVIGGTTSYSADVQVKAGLATELPGYRDAALRSLTSARQATAKSLAAKHGKTTAGWVSLATDVLGAAGAGAVYYLGGQAMTAYRTAPDTTSAAASWKDVQLYQTALIASGALGGIGLGLVPHPPRRRARSQGTPAIHRRPRRGYQGAGEMKGIWKQLSIPK